MISAWWLVVIVPAAFTFGVIMMALCVAHGRSRDHDDA